MKQIRVLIVGLFTLTACVQNQKTDQSQTSKNTENSELQARSTRENDANTDIRLLPKYGNRQKTKEQIASDDKFIQETLQQEQFKGDRRSASDHMIKLGFNYLYKGDLKTAMYRFNQAYLLDSLNTDIYWGYGGVYVARQDYEQAVNLYREGLLINPENTHLLTDLGTCFLMICQTLLPTNKDKALGNLDLAIKYMMKSYAIDAKDPNTTYKLSVCHLIKSDCDNAWKYYNECVALGGAPIPDDYAEYLKTKCKK